MQTRWWNWVAVAVLSFCSCPAHLCRGQDVKPPAAPDDAEATPSDAKAGGAAKGNKKKLGITISKEITVITEPLGEDGYPDYVEAVNLAASKGVTPENNASVLFWQALGPAEIPLEIRGEFFKRLGIQELPEEGDYLIEIEKFAESFPELIAQVVASKKAGGDDIPEMHQIADSQQTEAMSRPWTEEQLPFVAAWLKANKKPLALAVQGTLRPMRYEPLLQEKQPATMMDLMLPGTQQARQIGRLLVARAMLHLGHGRTDQAWDDLLACHRMASLVGAGPTLIDGLVEIALHAIASEAGGHALSAKSLTLAQCQKMRKELNASNRVPSQFAKIDWFERCGFAEVVCLMAKGGGPVKVIRMLSDLPPDEKSWSPAVAMLGVAIQTRTDYDQVARVGGGWYDRMAKIWNLPRGRERAEAFAEFDRALKQLGPDTKQALGGAILKGTTKEVSEAVGNVLVLLMIPALTAVDKAEHRCVMQRQINDLGFALVEFKLQHGNYPMKLEDLPPNDRKIIPLDLFSGEALKYQNDGTGFVLYSVGHNGIDDGGRSYADAEAESPGGDEDEIPDWDDLRIRVPAKN